MPFARQLVLSLLSIVAVATPARAEHASARHESFDRPLTTTQSGATETSGSRAAGRGVTTEYKRNENVAKIAEAGKATVQALNEAGSAAVKAIADSNGKFLQQVNQITSQNIEAGKEFLSQMAQQIPDPSTLVSSSDTFNQLAKEQAALNQTTIQMLQVQSQATAQLPAPTSTPEPQKVTMSSRLQQAASSKPPVSSLGRHPQINSTSTLGDSIRKNFSGLTRLPSAYNAPKGL